MMILSHLDARCVAIGLYVMLEGQRAVECPSWADSLENFGPPPHDNETYISHSNAANVTPSNAAAGADSNTSIIEPIIRKLYLAFKM